MKRVIHPSFAITLSAAATLYFYSGGNLRADNFPNVNVTNQITGGTTGTGSYFLGNTGKLLLSSVLTSNGLPAANSSIMYWNPANHSLAAGQWSDWSVLHPPGSFAAVVGRAVAPGTDSIASGFGAQAEGWCSGAIGNYVFSMGDSTFATGMLSYAIGNYSVAMGNNCVTWGVESVALGSHAWTSGYASFATGQGGAGGDYSLAGGTGRANGSYAVAFGKSTLANAFGCLAIGQYNVGAGGGAAWVSTDPIFEIGIGSDSANLKNAVTVYKDGTVLIPKRQGDISMGEFGN